MKLDVEQLKLIRRHLIGEGYYRWAAYLTKLIRSAQAGVLRLRAMKLDVEQLKLIRRHLIGEGYYRWAAYLTKLIRSAQADEDHAKDSTVQAPS